jgi:hypothetical protein
MSFIFNLFNKPQRTGDVESWDTEINGKWYHQKALVDKKNDNEIISQVDTMKYEGPHSSREKGHVKIGPNNKLYLVWD